MFSFSKPQNPISHEMVAFSMLPSAASAAADPDDRELDSQDDYGNEHRNDLDNLLTDMEEGRVSVLHPAQQDDYVKWITLLSEITDARVFLINEKEKSLKSIYGLKVSLTSLPCLVSLAIGLIFLIGGIVASVMLLQKGSKKTPNSSTYEVLGLIALLGTIFLGSVVVTLFYFTLMGQCALNKRLKYSAMPNDYDMILEKISIINTPSLSVNEVIKALTEKEVELRDLCEVRNPCFLLENLCHDRSSYLSLLPRDLPNYIIDPMLFAKGSQDIQEKINRSKQSIQSNVINALSPTGNPFLSIPVVGRHFGV